MAIVEPTNRFVHEFDSLHLYHARRSNYSGRVRLLLEEKRLPWESHHIGLNKKENVSEAFFGINPQRRGSDFGARRDRGHRIERHPDLS